MTNPIAQADGAHQGIDLMTALAEALARPRVRGPSTFEVMEVTGVETDISHGIFDTLDEARDCVEFDQLVRYEIWQGDHIVEEDDGVVSRKRHVFSMKVLAFVPTAADVSLLADIADGYSTVLHYDRLDGLRKRMAAAVAPAEPRTLASDLAEDR